MPNYEVGNLEIKFSALNEIDFEKLKDGLNKVKSAINNIGKIDSSRLDNFSKTLSNLSTTFLPFLKGVEKASGGLAIFNDTLRQVGGRGGARGLSAAVAEFEKLKDATRETGEEAQQLNTNIANATEQIVSNTQEAKKSMGQLALEQQQSAIAANQQKIAYLKAQYALGTLNLTQQEYLSLLRKLENEQRRLSGEIPRPYNAAQVELAQIQSTLYNTYFSTQTVNQRLVEEYNALKKQIDDTTRAVKEAEMTDEERVIARQKDAIAANQQAIAYLKAQQGLGLLNMTQEQYLAELQRLEAEQRRLRGELDQTNDTQKETEKQTKKTTSGWKKFLNQIKRIAIYRLIRTALRAIVSTFRDTINAFAEVDDNVNNSMSQITTSLQFIKLGLGTTLLPLLQMIAPIIEQIGYAFADLGNMISASMSKDGKYTKINKEAWKNYREEIEQTNGALLDFDKFRVLNTQKTGLSDFLIPNQDVKDLNEELGGTAWQYQLISGFVNEISNTLATIFETVRQIIEAVRPFLSIGLGVVGVILKIATGLLDILNKTGLIKPIIGGILGYLIAIGATKIISWLGSGKFDEIINNLLKKLNVTDKSLKTILGTNQALALSIGAVAGSIFYFISSLDKMGSTAKWLVPSLAAVAAGITAIVVALAGLRGKALLTAASLAGAITLAVGTAMSVANYKEYAQGGLPDKGTMFIAGEAGAEMVYNMPSGQSGVANVTQIEQAFYNALVRYGRENNGGAINVNVNLDGQQLYRSVERAAGQRGLGFARK